MQKLYIKIVMAIWIVMILSAAIAIALLRANFGNQDRPGFGPIEPTRLIANIINAGSLQTYGEGEAAFIDWFRRNQELTKRMLVKVQRSDGTVLFVSGGDDAEAEPPDSFAFKRIPVSRADGEYEVLVAPRNVPENFGPVSHVQRSIVRAAFQPHLLWWLLLVAVLLSVLLSVVVARYLVSPLRTIESAGKRLARGDLHVRVSPKLGHRRDEIADFASAFDHMASKIEGLVRAHQQLLRDVSHELRTPLSRVLAAASLARKAAGDSAAGEFDRIEQEVGRLDTMIGQLLTYAQLDADEARLSESAVHLDQLLEEIVDDSRVEADAHDRRIALDIVAPCTLSGDAGLLRSAIENVLRNALRHTPAGSSVDIRLDRRPIGSELTIRDHGDGVAEEELKQLFKPFYRTDAARSPQLAGSGIGLAIARKAIKLHGGWIEAENDPGGGLLVRVTLPVSR